MLGRDGWMSAQTHRIQQMKESYGQNYGGLKYHQKSVCFFGGWLNNLCPREMSDTDEIW
jgi:hypothetical protein